MKISTQTIMQQPVNAMLEQQEELYKTQKQLASGKKILQPSDDPTGTVRANQLRDSLSRTTQYIRSGESAESKLNLEESVIDSLTNAVQRIRELSIQSLNGTLSDDNRKAIGTEVEQLFYEVVNLSNSRNETGEYIFGGSQGDVKPFSFTESTTSNLSSKNNIGVLRPSAGVGGNGIVAETLAFAGISEGTPITVNVNAADSAETIAANITSTLMTPYNIFATAKTEVTLEHFTVGNDGDSIGFSISANGNTSAVTPTVIATAPSATSTEVTTILTQVQTAVTAINTANTDSDLSASIDDSGVITIVSASGRDISIIDVAGGGGAASIDVANTTLTEGGAGDSLNVGGSVTITNPDGTYYNVTSSVSNNVMEQAVTISETLSLTYNGDSSQRSVKIGDSVSLQVNDAGDEVFMNLASAADPDTDRSIFHTIHDLVTELKNGNVPSSDALTDLDTAMERLGETRTKVGARINIIDRQWEANTNFQLFAQENISLIEDIDWAEAISRLENQQLALQVIQQTYSRVTGLSMFNYI